MDKTTDLFDGVEDFFNAIKEKCANDEEYATEILKARGFLLEDGLILSDNSHKDDFAYLNELLKADNLGEVKNDKIFINPKANIEKIFYRDNLISLVATSNGESWELFVHNGYAPKIPVKILEPFVARYIKAISACGVTTWLSCDGNHHTEEDFQRILINFTSEPNNIWHELICKRLLAERFNLNWTCAHECLIIPFDKADKWRTYTEINRAGEFLYNNRIKIRQIRREASDGITLSMARHLSADELANIFSERANKLFDKLFKEI